MVKTQGCLTCRKRKSATAFAGPRARRCNACSQERPCAVCGEPAGLGWRNRINTYCDRPECQAEKQGRKNRGKRKRRARTRVCLVCGKRKALTEENFSVNRRNADGTPWYFHSYCTPCKTVEFRDRYSTSPHLRVAARAHAEARRQRILREREADPTFDAAWRERKREEERARRQRPLRSVPAEEPRRSTGGGRMPVAPLLPLVEEFEEREGNILRVARLLDVSDRTIRRWRDDPDNCEVQLATADRILVAADLLWWEVFDADDWPEAHTRAAELFAGEKVAA